MATYLDGNVRKATPNTVKAMERSAERRRCPRCGRKSALSYVGPDGARVRACRWAPERCDLTEAEAQREWISKRGSDPDYVGPRSVPSFARSLRAHRLRLDELTEDQPNP